MADVQRHRGERRRAPGHAAPLGRGDLRGHRAHPRGRGRRAREVRRHQAAARGHRRRQAHPRADRRRGVGLGRRAPCPAPGRLPHPVHRARHGLHPGGGQGHHGLRPRARDARLHGRRPHRQRRGLPGPAAARLHHRRRRGRALPRRHQERGAAGRGRRRARPGRRGRPRVPAQEPDAAGLEDALRLGAAARAVRRRPVPALRPPRQRHGRPAARRHRGGGRRRLAGRRRVHAGHGRQRRVRRPARGRGRPAAHPLPVLRLGRGAPRGAVGVRLRHDRGGRGRVHGRTARRTRPRRLTDAPGRDTLLPPCSRVGRRGLRRASDRSSTERPPWTPAHPGRPRRRRPPPPPTPPMRAAPCNAPSSPGT
ncbi:putative Uncharacterized 50.6 kDa protein in the 5'region of gyrA and gyrB [Micrococcus luteus]|nr:putative Uncharacterized 50.6 kDa protein in the 5'region of gyrA and gyrB [Micrococcus luteus]